jgi:hypothetical protein
MRRLPVTFLATAAVLLVGLTLSRAFASADGADRGEPTIDPVKTVSGTVAAPPAARQDGVDAPAEPHARASEAPVDAASAPRLVSEAPAPAPEPTRAVTMPDGSTLPVLNGAYGAKPPIWPDDLPYSPPVRTAIADDGIEWYVHDGFVWTTRNAFRQDLGRDDPVTVGGRVLPDVPIDENTRGLRAANAPTASTSPRAR